MSGTGIAGGSSGVASYGDLLVTSLVVLAGVCIAAFIVVRVLGRFLATGRVRGAHLLDVVARVPLEPRRSLYVVEVANKTLLVGTSEMGLSVLSELDAAEVRARVVERPTFAELVKQAWSRRRGLRSEATREPRSESSRPPPARTDSNLNSGTLSDTPSASAEPKPNPGTLSDNGSTAASGSGADLISGTLPDNRNEGASTNAEGAVETDAAAPVDAPGPPKREDP